MAVLNVFKMYTSISGEGNTAGEPCIILRLAGCDRRCRWCDTKEAQNVVAGRMFSTKDVADVINRMRQGLLLVTGGEPLLQAEAVADLMERIPSKRLEVETSQTTASPYTSCIPDCINDQYPDICMDVKTPSSGEVSDVIDLDFDRIDSLKFVIADVDDWLFAKEWIRTRAPEEFFAGIYVSPEWSVRKKVLEWLVGEVITSGLPVKLSLQLHKVLSLPEDQFPDLLKLAGIRPLLAEEVASANSAELEAPAANPAVNPANIEDGEDR